MDFTSNPSPPPPLDLGEKDPWANSSSEGIASARAIFLPPAPSPMSNTSFSSGGAGSSIAGGGEVDGSLTPSFGLELQHLPPPPPPPTVSSSDPEPANSSQVLLSAGQPTSLALNRTNSSRSPSPNRSQIVRHVRKSTTESLTERFPTDPGRVAMIE